jgi:hypothetical protein
MISHLQEDTQNISSNPSFDRPCVKMQKSVQGVNYLKEALVNQMEEMVNQLYRSVFGFGDRFPVVPAWSYGRR